MPESEFNNHVESLSVKLGLKKTPPPSKGKTFVATRRKSKPLP